MRLRQLARKLDVDTTKLIHHLTVSNLPCEDDSNAKLTEEQVSLLIGAFGPLPEEIVVEESISAEEPVTRVEVEAEPFQPEPLETPKQNEINVSEPTVPLAEETRDEDRHEEGEPEVIRAPKIELSGLKVVGKIELRAPKKKEEENTEATSKPDQPVRKARFGNDRNRQRNKTQKKTLSISEQRKREEKRQQRLKKEAEAKAKVQRKENYLKKVKSKEKAVTKKIKEKATVVVKPKAKKEEGIFKRFFNWMRRE